MCVSCQRPFLPGTSLEPAVIPTAHASSFTLQYISVLCVMFQVQLSFVVNLSNVFPVQLPNFSLSFSLLFQWLQLLLVQSYISGSTFVVSLYINYCILTYYYYYYYYCYFLVENVSSWWVREGFIKCSRHKTVFGRHSFTYVHVVDERRHHRRFAIPSFLQVAQLDADNNTANTKCKQETQFASTTNINNVYTHSNNQTTTYMLQ